MMTPFYLLIRETVHIHTNTHTPASARPQWPASPRCQSRINWIYCVFVLVQIARLNGRRRSPITKQPFTNWMLLNCYICHQHKIYVCLFVWRFIWRVCVVTDQHDYNVLATQWPPMIFCASQSKPSHPRRIIPPCVTELYKPSFWIRTNEWLGGGGGGGWANMGVACLARARVVTHRRCFCKDQP